MKSFKEVNWKKRNILISIVGVLLFFTFVLLYRSYAIYEEQKELNIMKGNIPEFMDLYDVKLSVMVDGVASLDIPEKNSNKTVEKIVCDRDAKGTWDYKNWKLMIDFKHSKTKCQVNFVSKYTDSILNGTDPVFEDGLIPVIIGNNGEVKKANLASEWYNYTNKEWANAVILFDESKIYQEGEVIPEENIESYFVWIPRYKYKIFNEGKHENLTNVENRVQEIEIEFENKDQAVSQGSQVGEWLSHSAFTSFNANGMWVGKFETGYRGVMTPESALKNEPYASKVQIKPNVYSWRGIQVSNAFIASYEYQREMDSHMMKNTEWGAVTYLSQSKYGIQASVRINNNSSFLTGYAAVNEPTCGYTEKNEECNKYEGTALNVDGTYTVNYRNNQSVVASTTGNYSGIYDMSGGAQEYVMGVMNDKNGNLASGRNDTYNSNFVGALTSFDGKDPTKISWTLDDGGIPYPESKYYDIYTYAEDGEHFNRRILGDATGEMGPFGNIVYNTQTRQIGSWYQDEGWFVSHWNPWFLRGGVYDLGTGAGLFRFGCTSGPKVNNASFRIVLAF